jgi:hypothetical protein
MCGLTNSKPDSNKDCQEFVSDQHAIDVNVYTRQNKGLSKKASLAITIAAGLLIIFFGIVKISSKADRANNKFNNFSINKYENKIDKLIDAYNNHDTDGIIEFGKWYNSLSSEEQDIVKERAKTDIKF